MSPWEFASSLGSCPELSRPTHACRKVTIRLPNAFFCFANDHLGDVHGVVHSNLPVLGETSTAASIHEGKRSALRGPLQPLPRHGIDAFPFRGRPSLLGSKRYPLSSLGAQTPRLRRLGPRRRFP